MPLIFLSSLKDRIRCQRAKPFHVKFFTAVVAAAAALQSAVGTHPLPAEGGGCLGRRAAAAAAAAVEAVEGPDGRGRRIG